MSVLYHKIIKTTKLHAGYKTTLVIKGFGKTNNFCCSKISLSSGYKTTCRNSAFVFGGPDDCIPAHPNRLDGSRDLAFGQSAVLKMSRPRRNV